MSPDYYQLIGGLIVESLGEQPEKAVLHARVIDGVTSPNLYVRRADDAGVTWAELSPDLSEAIYAFWTDWPTHDGNVEWRAMEYVIEGGRFQVNFVYPEPDECLDEFFDHEREAAIQGDVIRRNFGDVTVSYPGWDVGA